MGRIFYWGRIKMKKSGKLVNGENRREIGKKNRRKNEINMKIIC